MAWLRPGVVIAFAPGLGGSFVPARAKVALTVLVAIGLLPVVTVPQSPSALVLTGVIAREAAIGLALAAAMQALVAGVELAGHLSGYQIGYSYAATIDPMTGRIADPKQPGALRVWAFRDRPVYTFAGDREPGDAFADGHGEFRGQRNGFKAFWLRDDFFGADQPGPG